MQNDNRLGIFSVPAAPLSAHIAAVLLLALAAPPAIAGDWIGPDGGDWFDPANWQSGVVPTGATSVRIDNGTTAEVSGVSATAYGGTELRVGDAVSGGLRVIDGGSLSSLNGRIGNVAGSSGVVTVSGPGSNWTSGTISSGYGEGSGVLEILNGGTVVSTGSVWIGLDPAASGRVRVSGSGSRLTAENNLYVGSSGTGVLTVESGGRVTYAPGSTDRAIHLGRFAGASGTLEIDGAGSTLDAQAGSFYVGDAGAGTLVVRNGGVLTHAGGAVWVGHQAGATGVATVSGTGSRLAATGNLLVGGFGSGTLTIVEGGLVASDGFGLVGNVAGSVGQVEVAGAGSSWRSGGSLLFVGDQGGGVLTVRDGALVRVGNGLGTVRLGSSASGVGVLNIGAGGATGILDADVVTGGSGSATLNFNHSDDNYFFTRDGTAAGAPIAITGSTVLNHNGSGTTVLTGTNTHVGGTYVNAGRLVVNGSLAGDTVVGVGGALGGGGTVGNLSIGSGGTLAPGNSPGLLTVTGDLYLAPGSLTVMEIDGTIPGSEHDQINVGGTATLDGTLQLDFGYVPVDGERFNLINASSVVSAGDAVTGFADIQHNLGAALLATAIVDPVSFDILVKISQDSFVTAPDPELPGVPFDAAADLTRNQFNVATDLDRFSLSGQAASLIAALNTLPAEALPGAFDRISGVQHTHAALLYPRISRQFHDLLGQRLATNGPLEGTNAGNRFSGIKLAAAGSAKGLGLNALGNESRSDRRVWLQAIGSTGRIDRDRNASGADYHSGGLVLGAEADVSEHLTVGAAIAYTRSDADVRDGDLETDSYQAAVYGKWQSGEAYVRGTAGVGRHDTAASRRVSVGGMAQTAKADYDARTVAVSLEGGKAIPVSTAVAVTPFAGIDYVRGSRSRFTEKAAGDARLEVSSDRHESLQSVLGVRVQGDLPARGEGRMSAYVEAAWLHEFADRNADLRAGFVAAPVSDFRVYGPELDRNRARVGAGFSAQLTKSTEFELAYRGDVAGSDRHHALAATVRVRW